MHGGMAVVENTKRGPKPKPGARYPSGKLKPAKPMTPEERRARAPAIWARVRDMGTAIAIDPKLGTVLGRLNLFGVLSDGETATGFHIAEVVGRFEKFAGSPARTAPSPSYLRAFNQAPDPYESGDPQGVRAYERRSKRARKAYERLDALVPNDVAWEALLEVCVCNREINALMHEDLKTLLNQIGVKLGFISSTEALGPKPAVTAQKRDAVHMAEALVDAIAADFERAKVAVEEFVLWGSKAERGLIVYGVPDAETGETMMQRARMKLQGLMPEVLDAQLVRAAEAKGWKARVVAAAAKKAPVEAKTVTPEDIREAIERSGLVGGGA